MFCLKNYTREVWRHLSEIGWLSVQSGDAVRIINAGVRPGRPMNDRLHPRR